MECVQWKEGHHPEVNTTPAPGTELEQLDTTNDAPEPTTGSSYAASMASVSTFCPNFFVSDDFRHSKGDIRALK